MTRELLIEIIKNNLYFEAFIIIVAFLVNWTVNFRLGFRLLGEKAGLRKLFPFVLIMTTYSLTAKFLISDPVFGLLVILLIVVLFKTFGGFGFFRSLWTSLLMIFIGALGVILILGPLCALDSGIASFFHITPYGLAAGALVEIIVPGIALLVLSVFDISLVPLTNKISRIEIIGVSIFGTMFYSVYSSGVRLILSYKNDPRHVLTNLISEWIAAIGTVLGFYILLKIIKKKHESDCQALEDKATGLERLYNDIKEKNQLIEEKNQQIEEQTQLNLEMVGFIRTLMKNQGASAGKPDPADLDKFNKLTDREKKIIKHLANGLIYKEIASIEELTPGYVSNLVGSINTKLGTNSRNQIIWFATKNNLLD